MANKRKRLLVIMNPASGQADAEEQRTLIEARLDAISKSAII